MRAFLIALAFAASAFGIEMGTPMTSPPLYGGYGGPMPECARRWHACGGGLGYNGSTCCLGMNECVFKNEFFSMCQPLETMPAGTIPEYGACGANVTGTCEPLTKCKAVHDKPGVNLCLDPVHERERMHDCSKADRWEQCGGVEWTGPTACRGQNVCVPVNDWFHMCTPLADATDIGCGAEWAACGGKSYKGATCCAAGLECVFVNEWFSQCVIPKP